MNNPGPPVGPTVDQELTRPSTAAFSDLGDVSIPAIDAAPPPGWFERVDGRGIYLRVVERHLASSGALHTSSNAPDAWYVHGLAGSSTNWLSMSGVLANWSRGYLVDLPGHGRSDPPPRGRYSIDDDARLVAELIRRRSSGPVHLVGNSLGGMVSIALAAVYPALVKTLTLISPAVPDLRLGADRGADARLGLLLLPGTTQLAIRRLSVLSPLQRVRGMAELCFGDASRITEAEFEAAAADLAWRVGLPWVHSATISSLRALMTSYLRRGSFRAAASRITVPVLVIWGTLDRLVDPRLAGPTSAAFPDATLLMLADVGHTAQMEQPELTCRAVRALWARAGESHGSITGAMATSST